MSSLERVQPWGVAAERSKPSSSRTDSPMVTEVSWFEYCSTMILVSSMPKLECGQLCYAKFIIGNNGIVDVLIGHFFCKLGMTITRKQFDGVCRHDWRILLVFTTS